MVKVELIRITKADNGDVIYNLSLSPDAQEWLFQESKKRGITMEEYLQLCFADCAKDYGK